MAQARDSAQVAQLLGLSPTTELDEAAAVPALDAQVGKRVREARRRSGLDAMIVAEAVGLTRDKLSKIEHGRRRVAPRELPALARALNVSMASLLGTADGGRPALALAHRVAAGADPAATSGARARAVELLKAEDRLVLACGAARAVSVACGRGRRAARRNGIRPAPLTAPRHAGRVGRWPRRCVGF